MSDFSTARIGDKVYSLLFGEGWIRNIDPTGTYPMDIRFETRITSHTLDGFWDMSHVTPDLYWAKPEIIEPPPPKRMKKITRWFNVYPGTISQAHSSKDMADQFASADRYDCIPLEFEVPEDFTC